MENHNIVVLPNSKDLTESYQEVKKLQLRKYWDREELNEMIDRIQAADHRMLLQFLWMSGVRISEAVALKKKDIDFQKFMMTVRWLKSRRFEQRVLPIHPRLRELLMLYTASMLQDELVFKMTRQRAWQLTKKYLGGHPHMLRHSFAVNWIRCGGDLVVLHKVLGHSKIQTTMEYLKIVPIDQGKELIKIQF